MPGTNPQSGQPPPQQSSPPPPERVIRWRGWHWERMIVFALLLLVGGAVVNVAVAWGFTRWGEFSRSSTLENSEVGRAFEQRGMPEPFRMIDGHAYHGAGVQMIEQSGIAGWERENALYEGVVYALSFDAGWPLLSLRAEWRTIELHALPDRPRIELKHGVATTAHPREGQPIFSNFVYPSRPLPGGFIINTLFYGLLLWLLFAPFAARRMLRRRRGLCTNCAYSVGVSPVCTECGTPVGKPVAKRVPRKAEA